MTGKSDNTGDQDLDRIAAEADQVDQAAIDETGPLPGAEDTDPAGNAAGTTAIESPAAPTPVLPPTRELLKGLFMPGFDVLAPAWQVQSEEVDALCDAWAPVVDKWVPDLSMYMMEINAVAITLAIIWPRRKLPRKIGQGDGGQRSAPTAGTDTDNQVEDHTGPISSDPAAE